MNWYDDIPTGWTGNYSLIKVDHNKSSSSVYNKPITISKVLSTNAEKDFFHIASLVFDNNMLGKVNLLLDRDLRVVVEVSNDDDGRALGNNLLAKLEK